MEVVRALNKAEHKFVASNFLPVPLKEIWFISQVNHKKDWDIKREKPWVKTIGTTYPGGNSSTVVIFQDEIVTLEALGNITYGYLGSAAGFSLLYLHAGGDFADAGIKGLFTVSDSDYDKENIAKGFNWYMNRK